MIVRFYSRSSNIGQPWENVLRAVHYGSREGLPLGLMTSHCVGRYHWILCEFANDLSAVVPLYPCFSGHWNGPNSWKSHKQMILFHILETSECHSSVFWIYSNLASPYSQASGTTLPLQETWYAFLSLIASSFRNSPGSSLRTDILWSWAGICLKKMWTTEFFSSTSCTESEHTQRILLSSAPISNLAVRTEIAGRPLAHTLI